MVGIYGENSKAATRFRAALRGVTVTGDADGAVAELLRAFDAMSDELGAIDHAWVAARARFTLGEDGNAGRGGGG
jgi:hypothetical protein